MDKNINIKPSITVNPETEESKSEEAKSMVEERGFSEQETTNHMKLKEEDFIQGLIDATGFVEEEKQRIEIVRDGKLFFVFHIRPLSESEYNDCKKKSTKYVRNRSLGVKMPEDTDSVKYRASIVYQATVKEDREKLWDNKKVWETLRDKGLQILNGLDVIKYSLKAGEMNKIIDCIDDLSGFDDNLEEVVKN